MSDIDTLKRSPGQPAPLLIRDLFQAAASNATTADIVCADRGAYSYTTFSERVHRLANALTSLGIQHGMTVGVMDWDTPDTWNVSFQFR